MPGIKPLWSYASVGLLVTVLYAGTWMLQVLVRVCASVWCNIFRADLCSPVTGVSNAPNHRCAGNNNVAVHIRRHSSLSHVMIMMCFFLRLRGPKWRHEAEWNMHPTANVHSWYNRKSMEQPGLAWLIGSLAEDNSRTRNSSHSQGTVWLPAQTLVAGWELVPAWSGCKNRRHQKQWWISDVLDFPDELQIFK